jgi:uncharacterized protein
MGARPHAYADIARQLAGLGHAVLRYAKPGPGTGTEVVDSVAAKHQQHFAARADVARSAVDLLVSRAHDVPVVVAGHSEGAVVVSMLAPDDARVRGVIALSGPATRLFDNMREQMPVPPGSPDAFVAFDTAVAHLRAGRPIPESVAGDPGVAKAMDGWIRRVMVDRSAEARERKQRMGDEQVRQSGPPLGGGGPLDFS